MGILCVFCVYDTIGNRCFEKTSFPKRLERHVIAIKWPLQRSGGHALVSSKRNKSACAPIEDSGHRARIRSTGIFDERPIGSQGFNVFLQAEDLDPDQTMRIDLILRCMHMPTCTLYWILAHTSRMCTKASRFT